MTDTKEGLSDDLRAVLHDAPDFIARLDAELRYRYVNAQAARAGIPPEEWIGRTSEELGFDPEQRAPWRAAILEVLDTGETREVRASMRLGGETLWFETRMVPETGPGGEVAGVLLVARDVTERMEAFREMEEATRILGRTLESLEEAVFVVDPRTRTIRDCNAAATRIFGWSHDEMVGRSTAHLHVDEEQFEAFSECFYEGLRSERSIRGRFAMRRKDGTVFPTEHTVTLLDPERGLDGGTVSVVRDRTEEEEAQRELRHYNRRLEALQDMDRAILAARSEDEVAGAAASHALRIVECLRASVTLSEEGREGTRLAAVRTREGPGPREGDRIPLCPYPMESLARGESQRLDDILELPEPRPPALQTLAEEGVRSLLTVPLGKAGGLLGALTVGFDRPDALDERVEEVVREVADHLTLGLRQIRLEEAVRDEMRDRMEAEERAQTVQVRLEELLDNLELGLLRVSLDGIILERNDAARRILGLSESETLVGRPVQEVLWPGESWERILEEIGADGSGSGSVQARIRRMDGSPVWVSAQGRIVRLPGGETVVEGVFQDVTEEMRLRDEVVGISAQERLRIGQDLHDDLGQHLTGLAFVARDLSGRLGRQGLEELADDARDMERLANTAVKKTRHLARGVHPPALRHRGLPGALEELARDVEDLFGLATRLRLDGEAATASTAEAAHLFRIAQEALTNAARHGGAASAEIRWETTGDGRRLTVTDDGTGFEEAGGHAGLGLRIMRYRARLLGGALEMESAPEGGTTVRVSLPPVELAAIRDVPAKRALVEDDR